MLRRTVDECLARIAACDRQVRAWVEVSPQPALEDGPLRGIPFAAKDIFETAGMATEYGSPLYAGRKGSGDAAVITRLRRLGAVLLGKTHTTAFASFDPAPTRNPRALDRTPGGSSSGSAAAIAAGMAGFALGSQTQGSILRPASYCGVVGFKPTFGLISREGVLPFAPSLDTVGFFTETAADMLELMRAVCPPGSPLTGRRPALAAFRQPAIADALARLRAAGFALTSIDPPAGFDRLLAASQLINAYEGARTHEAVWRLHGERLGRKLAALIREGLEIPAQQYAEALDTVRAMRSVMAVLYREYPAILSQASVGPAPPGLESTGDPAPNAPWTALGGPAISVPMPVDGPPLGLQITAAPGQDAPLLDTAVQVESALC